MLVIKGVLSWGNHSTRLFVKSVLKWGSHPIRCGCRESLSWGSHPFKLFVKLTFKWESHPFSLGCPQLRKPSYQVHLQRESSVEGTSFKACYHPLSFFKGLLRWGGHTFRLFEKARWEIYNFRCDSTGSCQFLFVNFLYNDLSVKAPVPTVKGAIIWKYLLILSPFF